MSTQVRQLEYLLILDFEATCGTPVPKTESEIIEFPTLLYNIRERKLESTFHAYVRPVRHSVLTEFCTTLTGIAQEVVDGAETFPTVWRQFLEFLTLNGVFSNPLSYAFVTCGKWDLITMLPRQLEAEAKENPDISTTLPTPLDRLINIKSEFRKQYQLRHMKGMVEMLRYLKMDLIGRHHSGIDDCKNILRIVERLREDGWQPKIVE